MKAAPVRAQVAQVKPLMTAPATGFTPKNPDVIQLALQPILDSMSMELRARVKRTDTAHMLVALPLEKIMQQLATGTVRITFGELRRAATGVFSDASDNYDEKMVLLPLNEIIIRLNPGVLAQRAVAQKQFEVGDDIVGPFGAQAQGVKISPPPAKYASSPLPPPAPARAITPPVVPKVQPPATFLPRAVTPATPPPTHTHQNGNGASNGHDNNGHGSTTRFFKPAAPQSPVDAIPPTFAPISPITPSGPIAPAAPTNSTPINPIAPSESAAPITPISPLAPEPPTVIRPPAAIKLPEPAPVEQPSLSLPLSMLLQSWPDTLKLEIVQANLSNSQVALPLSLIEAGLKRGKVAFPWRDVRAMIKPVSPPPSANDGMELELPLHVIAPLFLSQQKSTGRPVQKATNPGAEEIPNLFFGGQEPAPVVPALPNPNHAPVNTTPFAPVAPPPAAPATPVAPIAPPLPAPVAPINNPPVAAPVVKPPDTNFFQKSEVPFISDTEFLRRPTPGTDFLSRGATPKEVVERALRLEGVAGAIIALPDGLKVASQVPPELNADTLAGFLPQLYGRVNQCSRELRMGELNNLNFTVGNIPWKIFRVSAVYFAAFGRAGQPLPTAQLAMLASELDRKKL